MDQMLKVSLTSDTGSFVTGFKNAEAAQDALLRKVVGSTSMFQAAEAAVKKLGLAMVGIGGGTTAAFVAMGKEAGDFEQQMRNVNTITKLGTGGFRDMSNQVVDLSKQIPTSAKDLATGMYDVVSTGYTASEATKMIGINAKAAAAGLTDAGTAGRAIMGVLKAYGMEASQAGHVSDVLFQTVNAGVITFGELAQGMSAWVPIAASMHVPLEDASAALATMTLAGIPAAEANTALARTMISIISPSDDMRMALQKMGFDSGSAAVQTLGFKGVMDQLFQATGGNVEQMRALFPRIEGLQGALALGAANGRNYADSMHLIADSTQNAGATQKAFDEQMQGLPMRLQLLTSTFGALRIELGSYLVPIFSQLVSEVTGVVRLISDIPKPILGVIGIIGTFGGVLLALGGAFLLLRGKQMLMEYSTRQLNERFSSLIPVTGKVILFISQLIANLIDRFVPSMHAAAVATELTGKAMQALKTIGPMLTIAAMAAIDIGSELHNAGEEGKQFVESLRGAADLKTPQGIQGYITQLEIEGHQVQNNMKAYSGLSMAWEGIKLGMPFMESGYAKQAEKLNALSDEIARAARLQDTLNVTAAHLGPALGMSREQIIAMSKDLKDQNGVVIDLTSDTWRVGDAYAETANKLGITQEQMFGLGHAADQGTAQFAAQAQQLGLTDKILSDFNIHADSYGSAMRNGVVDTNAMGQARQRFDQTMAAADALNTQYSQHERDLIGIMAQKKDAFLSGKTAAQQQQEAMIQLQANSMGLSDTEAKLTDQQKMLGQSISAIGDPLDALGQALQDKQEITKNFAQNALDSGKITKDAFNDLTNNVKLSLDEQAEAISKQTMRLAQWKNDTVTVTARMGEDVAVYIASMGTKGVDLMHQMATGSDAEVANMTNAIRGNIAQMGPDAGVKMDAAMTIVTAAARTGGEQSASSIAEKLGIGVQTVEVIGTEYGTAIAAGVNPVLAALGKPPISITYEHHFSGPEAMAAVHELNVAFGSGAAEGGYHLPRQAMFQPAVSGNGLVQWAEPETGGEWFIPAGQNKRRRSQAILEQVATSFGYGLTKFVQGGYNPAMRRFAQGGFTTGADVPDPPQSLLGWGNPGIGSGMYNANEVIRDRVKEWMDYAAPIGNVPPGAVRDWIVQAITLTASPMNWLPPLVDIAMFESGGNPHAINLTDSNAAAGHPSKGLMQTIDGTFSAYAIPGHGDIWNPVDNAAAAIQYIKARYGTPFLTPGELSKSRGGPYMGYALGGFLADAAKVFDEGGTLTPGINIVYNRTGKPETLVRPESTSGSGGVNVGPGAIVVSVQADAGVDADRLSAAVERATTASLNDFTKNLSREINMRRR